MPSLKLLHAAQMVQTAYSGTVPGAAVRYQGADVTAVLHGDGTLYIPGTDSAADWIRFNLPTARVTGATFEVFRGRNAAKGIWFYGFLTFAASLAQAMRSTRPKRIVGHSLGGAAAQILAIHFGIPALTFGSPKPCASTGKLTGESEVLNLVHPLDRVPGYPFSGDARHVGNRIILPATGSGYVHRVPHYMRFLQPELDAGRIKSDWPVTRMA